MNHWLMIKLYACATATAAICFWTIVGCKPVTVSSILSIMMLASGDVGCSLSRAVGLKSWVLSRTYASWGRVRYQQGVWLA